MKSAPLRPISQEARHSVIYQLFLRAFTPEGTLKAAAELLPHLAGLGVDIVYLCPCFVHDDDENQVFWSARQKKSGCNNPKNPYRMKDYFHVDPEYGTDEDLLYFVRKTHALGMKVMLDLVYLHCGPAAVFLDEHPDFVMRNPDGSFINAEWCFPRLNYANPELREFLFENMLYYINAFGVDGYRCDVADQVPLDFWEEARARMDAVNPDIIMLSEGTKTASFMNSFDVVYGFHWFSALNAVLTGKETAAHLGEIWTKDHEEAPEGGLFMRYIDNHDITNDAFEERFERTLDKRLIEAVHVANFTMDGVPMLYNGNEIGDGRRHSIFANLEHGRGLTIDWAQTLTTRGRDRLEMIRALIGLRHATEELTEGEMELLRTSVPERVFAFRRWINDESSIVVAINFSREPVMCALDYAVDPVMLDEMLVSGAHLTLDDDCTMLEMLPYGTLVFRG